MPDNGKITIYEYFLSSSDFKWKLFKEVIDINDTLNSSGQQSHPGMNEYHKIFVDTVDMLRTTSLL